MERQKFPMRKVTREKFERLKQILQQDGNRDKCPIWPDTPAGTVQPRDNFAAKQFWSPRAGGMFTIPDGVLMAQIDVPDEETRKRVSSWIWERNTAFDALDDEEEAELPVLTPASIRELAGRPPLTTEQRIDRALHAIGKPPACLAYDVNDDIQAFQAATGCGEDPQEMEWLLQELESANLVRNTSRDKRRYRHMLTLAGLNRLETGGDAVVPNNAFVAMWFNPEVGDAYEKGIEPAIRAAGYGPVRIDRKEHTRKIDDEIIAEIRRCRFMVCDLTSGLVNDPNNAATGKTEVARGSVYYEAGFAHGLGKEVIWTCRKDFLDQNRIHFDVRQYACVPWEKDKEEELREALYERIRAVIV